jgi:hypothetical protein
MAAEALLAPMTPRGACDDAETPPPPLEVRAPKKAKARVKAKIKSKTKVKTKGKGKAKALERAADSKRVAAKAARATEATEATKTTEAAEEAEGAEGVEARVTKRRVSRGHLPPSPLDTPLDVMTRRRCVRRRLLTLQSKLGELVALRGVERTAALLTVTQLDHRRTDMAYTPSMRSVVHALDAHYDAAIGHAALASVVAAHQAATTGTTTTGTTGTTGATGATGTTTGTTTGTDTGAAAAADAPVAALCERTVMHETLMTPALLTLAPAINSPAMSV